MLTAALGADVAKELLPILVEAKDNDYVDPKSGKPQVLRGLHDSNRHSSAHAGRHSATQPSYPKKTVSKKNQDKKNHPHTHKSNSLPSRKAREATKTLSARVSSPPLRVDGRQPSSSGRKHKTIPKTTGTKELMPFFKK